jgi:anaerobic selenocysteine-containing dehydrogenase
MARRVGFRRLWQAMRGKNTCKTCALGMGGQGGGMRNELGAWPEVCKKSFQATVADMQAGITPEFFAKFSLAKLQALSPRELEWCGRLTAPLYAGPADSHYRVVDWDFAIGRIAEQLKKTTPDENFFYCSGRTSKPVSCYSSFRGSTARTTSTTVPIIAIKRAAWRSPMPSAAAPRPLRWTMSSMPTCSSSSAATRRRIIRA